MKLTYHEVEDVVAGIVGSVICVHCGGHYAAYADDGETVLCPKCGCEQANPFYVHKKGKKPDRPRLSR